MTADDYKTPGQLIDALLTSRGWTQRTLAIVLGVDKTRINRIISDQYAVNAELALLLEEVFSIGAGRFLDLQKEYDLAKAQIAARPDPDRARRAALFGGLPVADMIKRRWLEVEDARDVPSVEAALAKFFGVSSPDHIEILPHAAKKTIVAGEVTPVQLAWLYRVRQIAAEMIVPRYSPNAGQRAVTRLSGLLASAEEARKVPRILAEAGIRYVVVESLPSAKIDGVCFWLDEHSPVIGMSLRLDRIDNFWFVLRHELEHVLRQHARNTVYLDADLEEHRANSESEIADEERIANDAAADFCVPREKMERFVARKSPFFAERDILGFARTLNIHPGLVAGQLQHMTARYDLFRRHLVKIRSAVRPSAMTDGWGDVAPVGL
jgi:HTH-type transcriptional regulator/antitoxin HigA